MLELYLTICVHEGRNCCEFCWQVRGRTHQWKRVAGVGWHVTAHVSTRSYHLTRRQHDCTRFLTRSCARCGSVGAILRRERKLLRTAGNTFSDFLASLNTLTVDGKKRQEGREVVVGGKNIPQMVSPDEACVGGAGGQRGQRVDSIVSQKVGNQTLGRDRGGHQ
jgi:hypothetical protein